MQPTLYLHICKHQPNTLPAEALRTKSKNKNPKRQKSEATAKQKQKKKHSHTLVEESNHDKRCTNHTKKDSPYTESKTHSKTQSTPSPRLQQLATLRPEALDERATTGFCPRSLEALPCYPTLLQHTDNKNYHNNNYHNTDNPHFDNLDHQYPHNNYPNYSNPDPTINH